MNLLDLLLILAAVGAAIAGYRRGLAVGLLSLAGFVGGAAIGLAVLPWILGEVKADRGSALSTFVSLAVVLIPAVVLNGVGTKLGWKLREKLTFGPARWLDGTGGGLLSAGSVLVVAWMLASMLATTPLIPLAQQIRGSSVLGGVRNAMPNEAPTWFARASGAISGQGFPTVFNPFDKEPSTANPAVEKGPAKVTEAARTASSRSVVKITGNAPKCGTGREGSGFVYAPHRVMTNAHVLAGVEDPVVRLGGVGPAYSARVVYFDDRTDVAVLDVPSLTARALHFTGAAQPGAGAIVSGFPEDGGLTLGGARVAGTVRATGQDIYGDSMVTRDIYTLRAIVRPGNSGGPLLTPSGKVYGVVFARSTSQHDTGYALTADQVAAGARQGENATQQVQTGGCTPG